MRKPQYTFEEFKARWPNMFKEVRCGFSLPKGWGPIVWKMCENLEGMSNQKEPWREDHTEPEPQVAQVKEKFGGLRFYTDNYTDSHDELISLVEAMSFYVCETCGTTHDVTTEGGWRLTLCGKCRKSRHRQRRWDDIKWAIRSRTPWYKFKSWRSRRAWKKRRERQAD